MSFPPVRRRGDVHGVGFISGNAFNPIFTDNRATLRFQTVCDMLDVVFIRFSIYESGHDDEALGRYCIPVSALLPGACLYIVPLALPFSHTACFAFDQDTDICP